MKTTFKDKILGLYRRTVYKHKWLKGPMILLSVFLLAIDHFLKRIRNSSRKILGIAFTMTFAFISCSFSSVIWDNGDSEFVDNTASMYYETETSYATLATETYIDEQEILNEDTENAEEIKDIENVEAVEDDSLIFGVDILNDIDLSSLETEDEETEEIHFNRDDWKLVLINKQHPIADGYTFELDNIKGSMQCDKRVVADLYMMIEAAYKDGINLVIASPYRASSRQEMLFDKKINKYTAQGMSYMDAYKLAAQAVTVPGCSEHEVGLAFDIICDNYSNLNAGFGDTPAGIWLSEHCEEYGFIVRYPSGKEDITGIEFEPWHFRYVGKNAATVIMNEGITLEEFWEKYL